MKQKTSKLRKLERERYSILTDDLEHCIICKQSPVDIHEIYSGSNRKTSMKNGFCIPLCRDHHRFVTLNVSAGYALKMKCQAEFEKTHTREEFIKLIGKSYIMGDGYEL